MSKTKPNPARTLIQSLGGPTAVAELLGYDKQKGGVQRVANWQGRGIPAEVRLRRPDIFPPDGCGFVRSPNGDGAGGPDGSPG